MSTLAQSASNSNATREVSFGNGRYSALMAETFKGVQTVFKVTSEHAEKIARQVGSDFGAAASNGVVAAKLGKVNKDGKLTLSEASKIKGVTMTHALFVMYALQWVSDAGSFGISYGNTVWTPTANLQKSLDALAPVVKTEEVKEEEAVS